MSSLGRSSRRARKASSVNRRSPRGLTKAAIAVITTPPFPELGQLRALAMALRGAVIDALEFGEFLLFFGQFVALPAAGFELLPQQIRLVAIKAQRMRTVVDAEQMMIAEGIEFFVGPILAIDDQCLIVGHVVGLAQILEERGDFRFEAFGQE